MLIMFTVSINGKTCGSTPLLYQAVRTARNDARRFGVAVDVDAVADDGQFRRVRYLPDGTLCRLWAQ